MVRLHLKGINTARKRLADGTIKKYYYHRGTGKRIKGKPGTPEFVASYAQAALREPTDGGTFASLISGFVESPEFQKLAEKTRKDYRRYLDALRDEFGSLPIDALSDRRIFKSAVPQLGRHISVVISFSVGTTEIMLC